MNRPPNAVVSVTPLPPKNTETLSGWMPEQMTPGALFLLDEAEVLGYEENPAWAVLACPQCGVLNLIKRTEYRGIDSITCWSQKCEVEFRLYGSEIRYRVPQRS